MGLNSTEPFHDKYAFKCAVADAKGPRRFMEDAHSVIVPFAGIHGQGLFAIFDGHAGKQAAEWCGQNFSLVR
jgi:protein phosphatase PTC1